jgi:hypothetical protein
MWSAPGTCEKSKVPNVYVESVRDHLVVGNDIGVQKHGENELKKCWKEEHHVQV